MMSRAGAAFTEQLENIHGGGIGGAHYSRHGGTVKLLLDGLRRVGVACHTPHARRTAGSTDAINHGETARVLAQ